MSTLAQTTDRPSATVGLLSPNRGIQELIKRSKAGVWLDEVIMEAPALAQSASDRYSQFASSIHTILVLAALGGWAIWH